MQRFVCGLRGVVQANLFDGLRCVVTENTVQNIPRGGGGIFSCTCSVVLEGDVEPTSRQIPYHPCAASLRPEEDTNSFI